MIFDLLSFCISPWEQSRDLLCKFCYGEDEEDGWLRPCKCCGTLKWVHKSCFDQWMKKAPGQQQNQCQTCRYVYKKLWVLKPPSKWCRPPIQLSTWDCIEVVLDVYSTYKFIRGLFWTVEGKRSIWVQCLHFLFWRTCIASDRRITQYKALGVVLLTSIFEIKIQNYGESDPSELSLKSGKSDELKFIGP